MSENGTIAAPGRSMVAPAKINLSLHVTGRRKDGYHLLSGLVAFAATGDRLEFKSRHCGEALVDRTSNDQLVIEGPFAAQLPDPGDLANENLILTAARLYRGEGAKVPLGTFTLTKNLPIASGIGGGSSDAAVTLKILRSLDKKPPTEQKLHQLALELGADVPMCLSPTARMISGIGERSQPVEGFPRLAAVLVNPGVAVATKAVFEQLNARLLPDGSQRVDPVLPDTRSAATIIKWLEDQRNDLWAPAMQVAPVIGKVLDELASDNTCHLARMSGSGATCFGLYDSKDEAEQAVEKIGADHPEWWVVATMLN